MKIVHAEISNLGLGLLVLYVTIQKSCVWLCFLYKNVLIICFDVKSSMIENRHDHLPYFTHPRGYFVGKVTCMRNSNWESASWWIA